MRSSHSDLKKRYAHREAAATLAISILLSGVNFIALAFPPSVRPAR